MAIIAIEIVVPGPKRSALQDMLANLGNEEDLPALQSGSASPPHGEPPNNNGNEMEGKEITI